MDIAMTKGFAASPKPFVGSRSDDDYQANDKEILEIIKSANLNAKKLKSLIYSFAENTPKDILSEEDREILSYIKTEKLDLQKLKSLYQNSAITNHKIPDLASIEGTYKNFLQTSKNNDLSEKDREILQIIKDKNLRLQKLEDIINFFTEKKEIIGFIARKQLDLQKLKNFVQKTEVEQTIDQPKDLEHNPRPIVKKILSFIEKENISIKEMGERAGLKRNTLRVFLYSGLSNNMKLLNLVKVTNLMNLSLDEFILDIPIPINRKKEATNEEIEHAIKEKILNFIKENKLSKSQLERNAKVHPDYIHRLLNKNGTKLPNIDSLISLAKTMECSLESFLPN